MVTSIDQQQKNSVIQESWLWTSRPDFVQAYRRVQVFTNLTYLVIQQIHLAGEFL